MFPSFLVQGFRVSRENGKSCRENLFLIRISHYLAFRSHTKKVKILAGKSKSFSKKYGREINYDILKALMLSS